MRRRTNTRARRARRGIALAEAIVGGVLLGGGLAVVISLSARSLSAQTAGEKRMTAAWLADERLALVVAQGVTGYGRHFDAAGGFDPPFQEYRYEVFFEDLGRGAPQRVTAVVAWGEGARDRVEVETLIAVRLGEDEAGPEPREPEEEVDRDARYFEEDDPDA